MAAAPLVVAPLAEPSAPIADTAPLALPETAAVEGALEAPVAIALPDLAADPEAPVLPNPQSVAPQIPAGEDDIVISTEPAAPFVVVEEVPTETPQAVETAEVATAEDTAIVAQANSAVSETVPDVTTDETVVEVVTSDVLAPNDDADQTAEVIAPENAVETAAEVVAMAEVAETLPSVTEPDDAPVEVEAPAVTIDDDAAVVGAAESDVAAAVEVPSATAVETVATVEAVVDDPVVLIDPEDEAVETSVALRLLEHATCEDMRLELVKDADHRFSDEACLRLIAEAVAEVCAQG